MLADRIGARAGRRWISPAWPPQNTHAIGVTFMMRSSALARLAGTILFLASGPVPWRAGSAEPDSLLKAFFEASDATTRKAAIAAIRVQAPDPLEVERRLRLGRSFPAGAKTGWQVLTNTCLDGKPRPYHVFVPKQYDPARKHPVFVSLHGGVSRPNFVPDGIVNEMRRNLDQDADKHGLMVIIPLGQKGATWFDRVGMANVLAQLAAVKRQYNVDENRVVLGGFSDGASGGFIMGLFHPTPWAGFLALSGSVAVANLAPFDPFPANLTNRPIHSTNGGVDRGYPSSLQKIFIDQLKALGAQIAWTDYPDAGHDPGYLEKESPKIDKFLLETVRNPSPKHIVWETVDPEAGRCDWARIDEIRDVGNNRGPEPSNLTLTPPVQFAFAPDIAFAGPGVRIQQIPPGSVAETAGLKPKDVLTGLDGVAVKKIADVEKVLLTRIIIMKTGEEIRGEYRRGDQVQSFRFEVPATPIMPIFKRTKPAGRLELKATGNHIDVIARAVARYTLFIRRDMFDLDREIQVSTNGTESFRARVKPDLSFMLEQAAEDDDRSTVYCAKIEVNVPAGAAQRQDAR
jgi:predicted esterase